MCTSHTGILVFYTVIIGKRFASPIKASPRQKRACSREEKRLFDSNSSSSIGGSNTSTTPCSSIPDSPSPSAQTTPIGEELDSNYQVHELPNIDAHNEEADPMIKTALLTRVELLEAENVRLKETNTSDCQKYLRIEGIRDDKLIRFYTGFVSLAVFTAFFKFFGTCCGSP